MLNLDYDKKNDVLYISIGRPKPSYGEEDVPGIVILKDIITDEITGITVFDFMKRIQSNDIKNLNLPISIDLNEGNNLLS